MTMKFKRFALVLAIVLMASTLTPVFASPFADVPADHWAYDAIVELAAAGLIEGYPDGTYGGARMMTRYEAAMVFARALRRLETQIASMDLLPELDKVKAELMAEIEAAKAAAGQQAPAETTIIERVIVDKDVDEETLARIRANEVAAEALEGDMAYLEARMLGLIDGIRYDLDQLKDRPVEVEAPSLEEIEALIAQRIEESILEAAAAAKETTIIERVVATTPELTKQDVEFIAEALIREQVSRLDLLVQENRAMISALSDWVDELDGDVEVLKGDVADLQDRMAVVEKVRLSGSLDLKGEKKIGKDLAFSQTGKLNLNVKASEATDVKAYVEWDLKPFTWDYTLKNYYAEVTSSTPLSRLLVGRVAKGNLSPFGYVLASADYGFGGLAKVDLIDDLSLNIFAGQKAAGDTKFDTAVSLEYKFIPELGIKLKGAASKPYSGMFENYAAGIGLFGEVAGITYTGDFAMDFAAKEKNYLGVATLKTDLAGFSLDGKVVFEEENYAIAPQLLVADNRLGVEGGFSTKFEPITLGARAYYEGLPAEGKTADSILAVKADASASFDLFLPVTLSGEVVANKTGDANAEFKLHALAKLEIAKKGEYGLRYGVNALYEKNIFDPAVDSPSWKNIAHILDRDEVRVGANVGYGVDLSSAKFDVDYKAAFTLPTQPKDQAMTLTHNLDLAYAFTKDVKLTLGGTVEQTIVEKEFTNAFGYKAGLSVAF